MFFLNSFWFVVSVTTEVGMMIPGVGLVYVPTTTAVLMPMGLVYGA
jgi:hypothetical protein